ncbi:MAG: NAD(P)-binding domain-containing protein [Chloroflexaceae bacterium]|nr:NAD(P)-binding domain-containing protein [Chloroflexaceae bacterium]
MGSAMAANLLKAGYELVVHNRTREKAEDLLAHGAVWAETPAAAAQQADCVITMLAHMHMGQRRPWMITPVCWVHCGRARYGLMVRQATRPLRGRWQLPRRHAACVFWMRRWVVPRARQPRGR